eukprot:5165276-Prymnesium_polylepis.1
MRMVLVERRAVLVPRDVLILAHLSFRAFERLPAVEAAPRHDADARRVLLPPKLVQRIAREAHDARVRPSRDDPSARHVDHLPRAGSHGGATRLRCMCMWRVACGMSHVACAFGMWHVCARGARTAEARA